MNILNFDKNIVTALYGAIVLKYIVSDLVPRSIMKGRTNAVKQIDDIEISFAQWTAVMEGNPCPFCARKNGQVISTDNPDYARCQPPAHINCVCTWTYIASDEVDGDGNPIQETWTAPEAKDRKQFRMFDMYNATPSQLDELARIYSKKGLNFLADIQNARDRLPWKSGMLIVEDIVGWEKILATDSLDEAKRKAVKNAGLLSENLNNKFQKKFKSFTGKNIILPETTEDFHNYLQGMGVPKNEFDLIRGYNGKEIIISPKDVIGMGNGEPYHIKALVHELFHSSTKEPYKDIFYKEGLTELYSRSWVVNNVSGANYKDFIVDDYQDYCADMLLQLINKYDGDKEKINKRMQTIISSGKLVKQGWKKSLSFKSEEIRREQYNAVLKLLQNKDLFEKEINEYSKVMPEFLTEKELQINIEGILHSGRSNDKIEEEIEKFKKINENFRNEDFNKELLEWYLKN